VKTTTEAQTAPGMPQRAAHGAEARCMIAGAEAAVWTERMLSALVNGVKGGKKKGLGLSRLWPNAYFAEHGLFALHQAWAAARQPR
jgi:hypothetical protein